VIATASLLALALASGPLAGVRREVLDNGMVVLLQEDRSSPLVTVGTMYRVGARNEAAGTTGLAHYCEHMNFRATRALPGVEITEAITRIGGRWQGYTWIDQTWYAETVPREALGRMLDFEHQRMTAALYDPEDFAKERTSVLAELHSYDAPHDLLYDAVLAASFEIHPYRHNTIGWLSDVEQVTRDDAHRFYRRYYHPNNAVLVIVGDVQAEDALRQVRERFAALPPAGEATAVRTLEPLQTGQRRVSVRRPGPNAEVLVAFRVPALADPDFFPMVLFDALLSGGKGLRFRHSYAVRAGTPLEAGTTGLATRARSEWQASTYPYVYTLAADVAQASGLAAAEQALFDAVSDAVGRAWSESEVLKARREIRRGFLEDLDDKAGRAHQLAFYEVAGGWRYLAEALQRLERTTPADVRRFATRWLRPERATVGWFEPVSAAEPATLTDAAATAAASVPTPSGPTPDPAGPPPAPPRSSASASPLTLRLANGARVVVAPRENTELFALRGRLDAGAVHDTEGPGVAALLTERLAALADAERDAPALAFELHDDPSSAANERWIELGAAGLVDELEPLLGSLSRILAAARTQPSAPDLAALRAAALGRARENDASVDGRLLLAARKRLFGGGARLSPAWGDKARLDAVDATALQAAVRQRVTASGLTLSLAGAVEPARLRPLLERTVGTLPAAPRAEAPTWQQARGPERWTEEWLPLPEKPQNEIRVLFPGQRSRPEDVLATRAILYLLGETGYAGRLGRALVDPGLVYAVSASLEEDGAPGFVMIRTAASAKDTPAVLRHTRAILEEVGRGTFTEAELREALGYLAGKDARSLEGSATRAFTLVRRATWPAPPAAPLTLAQLNDTARRLFARGAPLALVAGPGYAGQPSAETDR